MAGERIAIENTIRALGEARTRLFQVALDRGERIDPAERFRLPMVSVGE
jgi:hypothetical protein